jgi:hypothetical protein
LAERREHGHGERRAGQGRRRGLPLRLSAAWRARWHDGCCRPDRSVQHRRAGPGRSARATPSRPGRSRTSSPRRSAQRSAHCGSKEVVMSSTVETANEIRPFHVDIPEEELVELRRRIAAARWPSRELVADRSQGVQLATMQELARYWATEYDWRVRGQAERAAAVHDHHRRGRPPLHPRQVIRSSSATPPTLPPRPPGRGPRWPSRTPWCWPSACATCPIPSRRSPASRPCAAPGWSASSRWPPGSTAPRHPGPVAQVFRDAILPVILRVTANSKQVNQQFRYHIDWNTPTSSTTASWFVSEVV